MVMQMENGVQGEGSTPSMESREWGSWEVSWPQRAGRKVEQHNGPRRAVGREQGHAHQERIAHGGGRGR